MNKATLRCTSKALQKLEAPLPQLHLFTSCGGPLEYADEGQGPPLVAIHGAMGGYDQSLILARSLALNDHRSIALSRPGYLGSPLSSGATPQAQSTRCRELLDHLEEPKAIVAAISGGGPCALSFALQYPERCRGLILVSTIGSSMSNKIPLSFRLMTTLARRSFFAKRIEAKMSKSLDRAIERSIPDASQREETLSHPEAGPLFKASLASIGELLAQRLEGTANDIAVSRDFDLPLEQIGVPALVIHGRGDSVAPFKHGQELAERLPNAQAFFIDGGQHVALFTHMDEIRAQVRAFVDQLG